MGVATLLVISRNGEDLRSQPIEGESVLGRSEDCDIRLDDRAVSRRHAVLRVVGNEIQIEKKSDFAPLLVNGTDCTQAVIKEGDVISIGPYLMKLELDKKESETSLILEEDAQTSQLPEQSPENPVAEAEEIPVEEAAAENFSEVSHPQVEGEADSASVKGSDFLADEGDGKTRVGALPKIVALLRVTTGTASHEEFQVNKPEIIIGRGQNCDLIIQDKKSSRKHAVIRQSGIRYFVKDLDSANGTLVNGQPMSEQELSSEDVIKIGETEIQFLVSNPDYEEQQKDFIRVTPELDEEGEEAPLETRQDGSFSEAGASVDEEALQATAEQQTASGVRGLSGLISGIPGLGGDLAGLGKKQSLIQKFRALPPKRQAIVGALIFALLYFLFEDDPESEKQIKKKNEPVSKKSGFSSAGSGTPVDVETKRRMDFQRLSATNKKFIETQYALAFDFYRNRDYDKTLFELEKIFVLVQDYERAREIESYAKEGKRKVEALQEEKRRKDEEEKIRRRVRDYEKEIQSALDKKDYDRAKEAMAELLNLDPENSIVKRAQKIIEEYEDQKRMDEQQKQVQMEINNRAKDMYTQALRYQKEGRCYDAMDSVQRIGEIGATELEPIGLAKKLISECKNLIRKKREPLLEEAREKEKTEKYREAFELYRKATQVDPRNGAGYAGMNRVRDTLHQMARVIYTEAVFAESFSDFKMAQEKFKECMSIAPEDDHYYEVSKKRLVKYLRHVKRVPADE